MGHCKIGLQPRILVNRKIKHHYFIKIPYIFMVRYVVLFIVQIFNFFED